ncbi:hypothetical protein [Dongshaea marina]|uniref:hypothetical protein n=1 Tax=Dongshaea marina TaxID=2047966 RepID=UPI000D3EB814|nr:hypothetical protein [Dongshaea marina]
MIKNIVIALLAVACVALGVMNYQQKQVLKPYREHPVKVLDCQNSEDPLVSLWCRAGQSFDASDYAKQGKESRSQYIDGWLHGITLQLDDKVAADDSKNTQTSPVWRAAERRSQEQLGSIYGKEVNTIYSNRRLEPFIGGIGRSYANSPFTNRDILSKNQYTIGYLTGRLYGLQEPHSLEELINDQSIASYSEKMAQALIEDDHQSPMFNQGLIDGVHASLLELSRKLKEGIE